MANLITRFAPTPSGFLHLGNIFSFILTYHLAKKHDAKILLRIDDLDQQRAKPKYLQDIFDSLNFLEIPFDLGPKDAKDHHTNFSQRLRMPQYLAALEQLNSSHQLFACDCSRNKIRKMHPKGFYMGFCRDRNLPFKEAEISWRFKTPGKKMISFKSYEKGNVSGEMPLILNDFVIKNREGLPSYQLTSVVDDLHYGVNLIVRGKDLFGSTLAQVYLSKFIEKNDFDQVTFHHHPLIKDQSGVKLSKSAGSYSVQHFRKSGNSREEVYQAIGKNLGAPFPTRKLEDFAFLVS